MDVESEGFELKPEKATKLRYTLAFLALLSETSQALANFCGTVTFVTARHVLHVQYEEEFQGIVRFNDNTNSFGSGCPQSED